MEKYPPYQSIFSKLAYGESQMLDKGFYEEEVKRLCLAFEQQVFILWKLLNCICVESPWTFSCLFVKHFLKSCKRIYNVLFVFFFSKRISLFFLSLFFIFSLMVCSLSFLKNFFSFSSCLKNVVLACFSNKFFPQNSHIFRGKKLATIQTRVFYTNRFQKVVQTT